MTLVDELTALRTESAFCVHDLRTLVAVSGRDHRDWLDRLMSNPVRDEPVGRCVLATFMDGKGKMRADLRMFTRADDVLLDIPASHREALLRVLDMFIIKEDVVLADLADTTRALSVIGPDARASLGALDWPLPESGAALVGDALPAGVVTIVESKIAGLDGVDIFVQPDALEAITHELSSKGLPHVSLEALDVARIEAGVPWFASEMADGVIPLEAVLDDWVSITKGCYPGQEVIARITNLGQVARKLVRLEGAADAALAAGDALTGTGERAGKKAGTVTSVARDPAADVTRALAYVGRAYWKTGTEVLAGDVPLTITAIEA